MQIVGTITLTTHAHQTTPDGKDGNRNETTKTHIFCQDGTRRRIPFITANSVRGLLRRAAADRVMDALGQPVTRQMFHVLTRGAADRAGIGETPTVAAMTAGNRHVFAGLFGGGPYMLHSRYGIGPLLPLVAWCEHLLHPALKPQSIPLEQLRYKRIDEEGNESYADAPLTTDIILTGKDDLMMGKGENRIANYQESLAAWLEQVQGGRVAKADLKSAKKAAKEGVGAKVTQDAEAAGKSSDLNAFTFVEAMLPGTPLQFWLRLKPTSTRAQIGLALIAVRDWANANVLGGASARGFGRFNAQLALYDGDVLVAPTVFKMGDHATAYSFSDEVTPYVDAAQRELDAMTIEDLDMIYPAIREKKKKAA